MKPLQHKPHSAFWVSALCYGPLLIACAGMIAMLAYGLGGPL